VEVSLVHVKPDGSSREVVLETMPYTIGRAKDASIRVPFSTVSRSHCEIWLDEDEDALMVKDLGSSNGTYINGQRVAEAEMSPGDLLTIGPAVFVVRLDGYPEEINAAEAYAQGAVSESTGDASATKTSGPDTTTSTGSSKASVGDPEDSGLIDFDFGLEDDDDDDQPAL
jgi:pSer/pThr/pTyr-binding forkhead associated (FHA) protein